MKKCRPCLSGRAPESAPTFNPNCPGCQAKKASGKRTGNEPMALPYGHKPKKLHPEQFAVFCAKQNKAAEVKRKRSALNFQIK
ncbi:hypothetical protein UFOVP276_220 [uncultured Caudovirales phage]|uniref:Uncharacterized protein n=1 Tax=uncultured Caudovirales phage TaxID=2100421 RepID=A0A6J5LAW2_9CAUD|nr:hypothetical protein UFOVP127_114 [uncultured Caudovirales phage]CAB4135264.1 hypothetical protein UFOVP276_220 [uncultured Caudovirales phage]